MQLCVVDAVDTQPHGAVHTVGVVGAVVLRSGVVT